MVDLEGPIRRREEDLKAQQLMRDEMEAGLHKPKPARLEQALSGLLGDGDGDVEALALEIINQFGENLTLGFREWRIVQNMIEAGLRRGYATAEELHATDLGG